MNAIVRHTSTFCPFCLIQKRKTYVFPVYYCNSSEMDALSLQPLSKAKNAYLKSPQNKLGCMRVHACVRIAVKIIAFTNTSHLVSMYSRNPIVARTHYCTPRDQLRQGKWWTTSSYMYVYLLSSQKCKHILFRSDFSKSSINKTINTWGIAC